jgi:tetratricopeptide (TPR) repeat protein
VIGRHDEAIAEAKRAIDIDPLSANAAIVLAQVLFFARRFDAAEVAAREALELDPTYLTANVFLGFIHLARQEYDPAVSMLEKAVSIDPHHERIGSLALALGLAGRRDQAVDMLQRLTDLASRSYVSPFSLAEAHAGLRQTEPWRQAMAAALEERAGLLVFLDAEWWDTMRDDPYMAELRRKVGLPAPL